MHRDIQRVARAAGDDDRGRPGAGDVAAQRLAGLDILDVLHAGDGIGDGAIAGAAAQIALQRDRQVPRVCASVRQLAVMIMPAVQKPH